MHTRTRATGFSLIELMVGMLISLIGTLAMMKTFAAFEAQKRTTTSGDDAQQNGAYSMYELERQLRTAGSGLVQGKNYGLWGCAITAYSNATQRLPLGTAKAPAPFGAWTGTMYAVPVLIANGATSSGGDQLAMIGGNPAVRTFKSAVTVSSASDSVDVDNAMGIYKDDYLLGSDKSGNCSLALASADPTSAKRISLSANDSPSAGFKGAFSGQGYLFDLGPAPAFTLFGVDTGTNELVSYDLLQRSGSATVPLADGIVTIKALYGVDDGANGGKAGDGEIDEWVAPTGSWSLDKLTANSTAASNAMAQIKAIRIAIVAQSELPERADAPGVAAGYTGATSLTLFGDLANALQVTVTTDSRFRYKVYDTVIPLRNAFIQKFS
ncbi:PilW family protein [Rudaea cellulosilytica]|uniref:PilW family protein n=1 Tax=Rudaea cellulosilytica TaxID=540746 RepID=UPI00035D239A|nr:PilW family protein [Rudaea cellulosilytica]